MRQRCAEGRGGGLQARGGLLGGRQVRASQLGLGQGGPDERALGGYELWKLPAAGGVQDGGDARLGLAVGEDDAEHRSCLASPQARFGGEAHGFAGVAQRAVGVSGQLTRQRQALVGAEQQARVARRPGGFDGLLCRPRSPRASRPSWISGCSWVASSTGMK